MMIDVEKLGKLLIIVESFVAIQNTSKPIWYEYGSYQRDQDVCRLQMSRHEN